MTSWKTTLKSTHPERQHYSLPILEDYTTGNTSWKTTLQSTHPERQHYSLPILKDNTTVDTSWKTYYSLPILKGHTTVDTSWKTTLQSTLLSISLYTHPKTIKIYSEVSKHQWHSQREIRAPKCSHKVQTFSQKTVTHQRNKTVLEKQYVPTTHITGNTGLFHHMRRLGAVSYTHLTLPTRRTV